MNLQVWLFVLSICVLSIKQRLTFKLKISGELCENLLSIRHKKFEFQASLYLKIYGKIMANSGINKYKLQRAGWWDMCIDVANFTKRYAIRYRVAN